MPPHRPSYFFYRCSGSGRRGWIAEHLVKLKGDTSSLKQIK